MLNDFGVQVTIVEASSHLLPAEDEEVGRELTKMLTARGVEVITNISIQTDSCEIRNQSVSITIEQKDDTRTLSADKLLLSVGRIGNTENIGLENTDVRVANGVIVVNVNMQTTEPHIYAIGDCIGGLQLAHAASHEGIAAVNHLAGERRKPTEANGSLCIYTRHEVASVGLTEKQAKERGHEIRIGKFPFSAIGKSLIHGTKGGFVKVIADQKTQDILGVHMIGPHVTELIGEAALAQVLDATPWEVGAAVHAHPSLSEIIGEAMLAVDGRAIGL